MPIESIYEVAAQGLWDASKFEFLEGSTLISGMCYISVSSLSELNKPVTVESQILQVKHQLIVVIL